jgi:primary-amine oxidase
MVLDRLKQLTHQVSSTSPPPHPFDPLSTSENDAADAVVRATHGSVFYKAVTLNEPKKEEMLAWLADPEKAPRPKRVADVVAIGKGSKVYDGLVDLEEKKVIKWESLEGVQPLITMEDLQIVEHKVRVDEKVIEQCEISGILRSEMHKVYCDREYLPKGNSVQSNLEDSLDNWLR